MTGTELILGKALYGLIQECEYSASSGLPFNSPDGKGKWTQLALAKEALSNVKAARLSGAAMVPQPEAPPPEPEAQVNRIKGSGPDTLIITCPKCGAKSEHNVAVKQATASISVVR